MISTTSMPHAYQQPTSCTLFGGMSLRQRCREETTIRTRRIRFWAVGGFPQALFLSSFQSYVLSVVISRRGACLPSERNIARDCIYSENMCIEHLCASWKILQSGGLSWLEDQALGKAIFF